MRPPLRGGFRGGRGGGGFRGGRGIEEEKQFRDSLSETQSKDITELESQLSLEVDNVRRNRQESELRVQKILEEASFALRNEFTREMRLIEEAKLGVAHIASNDLPALQVRVTFREWKSPTQFSIL